jgi:hypothetical protein
MEPQVQLPENVENNTSEVASQGLTTASEPTLLETLPSKSQSDEQWQQFALRVRSFLSQLPDQIAQFYRNNKQPITITGILIVSLIGFRVLLAVLEALNGIPLLAPMLELVGTAYIVWFTNRYLLKAATRQELSHDIQSFKREILGNYQLPES